jgi:hypothetical protein
MKNLLFPALCLILFCHCVTAQSNFYNWSLYGSIAPKQAPVVPDVLINRLVPLDEFAFNLKSVNSELSIGVRRNFKFSSPFFGTLGAEYSQKEEVYSMSFTYQNERERGQYYEIMTNRKVINIPVGVGVRMGLIDVTSGLKAQYTLESSIQGEMPMGIQLDNPRVQVSWYGCVGLNLNRFRIGVAYQSMLVRDGNYLIHDNTPMELMRVPNNVHFNVGFSF